ncbi:family 20 glycosylhydrolase [candidate division KSB1 bacterium]|nr:family 20 glycosylhydrolase [candidate division KSB1 bacterium]
MRTLVQIVIALFVTFSYLYAESTVKLNLLPVPKQIELEEGAFRLNEDFTMAVRGSENQRLYRAATRTLRRLSNRTGLFFSQDFITPQSEKTGDFIIQVNRTGQIKLHEDESYTLDINNEQISLSAETDIGAMRGLETVLQLMQADAEGYYFPSVHIEDAPRFPWRGLLIDVARHWMPVEVIKRNLDGIAAAKMNVLHWHLTEDQGFRVECKTFPKLHELGSDGFYYTQAQIKEIIDYAADRGIRVMPEFDIPGHSTSWFVGYPEYASQPGPYTVERKWGIMDPAFNPARAETYEFFDAFFKEMSDLFPDDYIHIGGDENNGIHWDANEEIQQFKRDNNIKDNHELQSYFNKRLLNILQKYDKKMVGWDEILQPDSPKDIVIQSWRGKESLIHAAKNGYQVLLSNGYYIDLIQPTDYHYLNDPLTEDMDLTPEQAQFILGGEATMWAEFVTPEIIDSRIWPRTAAIAERLWSPGDVRDVENMYDRLETFSFRLEELALQHEKNYLMMLRRLTNNRPTEPLQTLVDVVEPLKIYRRGQAREFTQHSPYTRVMDAARADQKVAREFRALMEQFLADGAHNPEMAEKIRQHFYLWAKNHSQLVDIIEVSPILREIESLSEDLQKISLIGLELMDALTAGEKIAPDRGEDISTVLKAAKKQRGQVELQVVEPIEKLLAYVSK